VRYLASAVAGRRGTGRRRGDVGGHREAWLADDKRRVGWKK
jgi:hypothetical protein